MKRTRQSSKRHHNVIESSDEEELQKKKSPKNQLELSEDSSSDSDIERYLKTPSKLDLDSSFFNPTKESQIDEKNKVTSKVTGRLSDSETSDEGHQEMHESQESTEIMNDIPCSSTMNNFEHMNTYNAKLEEAKRLIEMYKAKKATEEPQSMEINDILEKEERDFYNSLGSSGFETLSDEENKSDWEEVQVKEDKSLIQKGVEITIKLPDNIKKKKSLDLMAAVKRRINRVKKENQVFVHKVHLLCWIAHGLHINTILNNQSLLAIALSLLPSKHCYPSSRVDLNYLENIVQWYKKMMINKNLTTEFNKPLEKLLEDQMFEKAAHNYKMYVYIFICILRSLGVKCRLILSVQVEPLRPPQSELCSVSNKSKPEQEKMASSCQKTEPTKKRESTKKVTFKINNSKSLDKSLSKSFNEAEKKKQKCLLNKEVEKSDLNNSNVKKTEETKSKISLKEKLKKSEGNKKSKISAKNEGTSKTPKEITIQNKTSKKSFKRAGESSKATEESKGKVKEKVDTDKIKENQEVQTKKSRPKKLVTNTEAAHTTQTNEAENVPSGRTRYRRNSKSPLSAETLNNQKEIKTRNCTKENVNQTSVDAEKIIKNASKNENQALECKNLNAVGSIENSLGNSVEDEKNSKCRRKSKSPTSTNKEENIKMKDDSSIKSRLRKSSISPTTTEENVLNNNSEIVPKRRQKVGLKIKLPLQKSIPLTNDPAKEPIDKKEDDQEPFQDLKKKFSLPIIKTELLTPNKPNCNSDDEFLGFTTENTDTLIIPQLDGGRDTPPTKRTAPKPNLTKLKTSPVDKCPRNHPTRLRKMPNYSQDDSDDDFAPKSSPMNKTSPFKTIHSKSSTSSQDSEKSRFFGGVSSVKSKQLDVRNDIISLVKGNIKQQNHTDHQKLVKRKSSTHKNSDGDDSDYIPEKIPRKKSDPDDVFKKKSATKVKRRIPMKKDLIELEKKRMEAREELKRNKGINVWVEVFAEAEEKWISVDVIKGQVHCVKEIYTRTTHPVSYILSFDNDNHIKDVTKRYCENWNTVTRKLRIDDAWWEKTLRPYRAPRSAPEKEEDEDLARQQLDQPLPKTISEYKNHPLYVLKRHLLKFEALYPPDALTLGFVRNEPVYSRDCVYVLHSRDIWLKHAKVVKLGEKPYKIVKARPKYDKLSNTVITDQMLEIFGKWQIEDYVPPTAENGIVPKNAYGNVDLFKPCMLPKGTVHLQFPGLNKVARKLNIDCPPAVTGFDFHSGFSHPTFDGFVVCEEFSEQLVAAWVEEQEEFERKEQEKNEKRIYDNWKKLIKGLLIRERLKKRYDFGAPSNSKDNKSEDTRKSGKKKRS